MQGAVRSTVLACAAFLILSGFASAELPKIVLPTKVPTPGITKATPKEVALKPGGAEVAVHLEGSGLDTAGLKAVVLRNGAAESAVEAKLGPAAGGASLRLGLQALAGAAAGALKVRLESGDVKIEVPLTLTVVAAPVVHLPVATPTVPRPQLGGLGKPASPGPTPGATPLSPVGLKTGVKTAAFGGPASEATPTPASRPKLGSAIKGLPTPTPTPAATGKFKFGDRELTKEEFRAEVKKLGSATPLAKIDVGALSGALAKRQADEVMEANRLLLAGGGLTRVPRRAFPIEEGGLLAATRPYIEEIVDEQAIYIPGSMLLLRGWNLADASVLVRYRGERGDQEAKLAIENINTGSTRGGEKNPESIIFARFPEAMKGLTDHTAHVRITRQAQGKTLESNEVPLRLAPGITLEHPEAAFRPHIDGIENDHLYSPGGIVVLKGKNFFSPKVWVRFKGKAGNDVVRGLALFDGFAAQSWDEKVFAQFPEEFNGFLDQTAQVYIETEVLGEKLISNEVPVQLRARRVLKLVNPAAVRNTLCVVTGESCSGYEYLDVGTTYLPRDTTRFNYCFPHQGCGLIDWSPDGQRVCGNEATAGAIHSGNSCPTEDDWVVGADGYEFDLYNGHLISSVSRDFVCWSNGETNGGEVVFYSSVEGQIGRVSVAFAAQAFYVLYTVDVVLEGPDGVPFTEPW